MGKKFRINSLFLFALTIMALATVGVAGTDVQGPGDVIAGGGKGGAPANRVDRDEFDGIYSGTMKFFAGTPDMPLDVSLILTDEYVTVPKGGGVFEEQQVIDGAFQVDGEGGPFSFWRVSYNLERSEIDMRYNRPNQVIGVQIPPGFRLIGKFKGGGVISGKVVSGMKGPIGTFEIKRTDAKMLVHKRKYIGRWAGEVTYVSTGQRIPIIIEVQPSGLVMVNPTDMEFDFTDGKTAHYMWRGVKLSINKVVVDYLRRKMYLFDTGNDASSTSSAVTLECQFGVNVNEMNGQIVSRYRGVTATFHLARR